MAKKTFVIGDVILKKIEDIARKKNVSQSRVVSDLLELGLQKKDALDSARELEKIRFKNDIVSALKSELADAKTSLGADLQTQKSILQETLYNALLVKKFSVNAAAQIKIVQANVEQFKQEARQELEQFLQALE